MNSYVAYSAHFAPKIKICMCHFEWKSAEQNQALSFVSSQQTTHIFKLDLLAVSPWGGNALKSNQTHLFMCFLDTVLQS